MIPHRTSRCLSRRLPSRVPVSCFSTSSRRNGYDDTIQNLKIGKHTRVIFQGFTGKQATANAKESIEWGTNIVGGVKPNGSGEHLGLPVLPSVRAAMEQLKPDATGIYVAAHQAAAAIEEAIEAEVPLIVAVAEHIPIHDIMRVSLDPFELDDCMAGD
jgi:succinyl-CoA synthetase alpha subunit